MFDDLLLPMFDDDYYPDILVAEVKQHIQHFAKKVSVSGLADPDIYHFAQQCMREIHAMKPQFEDLDSHLDDTALDHIAEAMMMVVQEAGYLQIEIGELSY